MANTEHNALTTSALHENKGVSTATDNTVATAVTGATVWAKLTASNLTTTGNSFGAQLFQLIDQKVSGTNAGGLTAGTWTKRTLAATSPAVNEITSASVASSVVTLPAGTYFIEANAPAFKVTAHQIRWRNTTDGTTTLVGSTSISDQNDFTLTHSFLSGRFTIAGAKNFELQHNCSVTRNTTGAGQAASFGDGEVYAQVNIWKVL